MQISLNNKVVLVTGSSSGIGKSIAEHLAMSGATVAVHYHSNNNSAQELADKIGNHSQAFQANLANAGQTGQLFSNVVAKYGRLDVLINNAGIYQYAPVNDKEWLNKWQQTIDTNLTATGILCQLAIKHFIEKGGGRIINISSRAAFRGDTGDYLAYAASKGGMVSLTKTIARSFGKNNIQAFSIAPGFVRTPMAQEFIEENGEDLILKELALERMTEPQDIAPVVCFLAAGLMDHATGSTIDLNAGSYMR
jgi:3-oxoacyl-[acyl-carrier protein] reductase